jgi:hypothetical protein
VPLPGKGHFGPIWAVLTRFQLPAEFEAKLVLVQAILIKLHDGQYTEDYPNPAYTAPARGAAASANAPPPTLERVVTVNSDKRKALVSDLRDICQPIAKRLAT